MAHLQSFYLILSRLFNALEVDLVALHPFSQPSTPTSYSHQSVLCTYELVFLFLDSKYERGHIVFVFLCVPYFM